MKNIRKRIVKSFQKKIDNIKEENYETILEKIDNIWKRIMKTF